MTYNITLTANHQSLTAEYLPLAAESVQYLTAKVVCETEDWTGREIKALFGQGCTVYEIPVTGGEITAKQQLNLTAGDWCVWLVGNSARDGEVIPRITTNVAHISVAPTGGTEGNPFPAIPPTVEEQLRADMGNLADLATEDKSSLVAAINEAAASGGSKDAVTYTPQTLTEAQQKQARANIGAGQPVFAVNVTLGVGEDGRDKYTADKTAAEIEVAYQAGRTIVCKTQARFLIGYMPVELPLVSRNQERVFIFAVEQLIGSAIFTITVNINDSRVEVSTRGVEIYEQPADGIPKTDLADDVQTSLAKADTAISYNSQTLTEEQKSQARTNIGAVDENLGCNKYNIHVTTTSGTTKDFTYYTNEGEIRQPTEAVDSSIRTAFLGLTLWPSAKGISENLAKTLSKQYKILYDANYIDSPCCIIKSPLESGDNVLLSYHSSDNTVQVSGNWTDGYYNIIYDVANDALMHFYVSNNIYAVNGAVNQLVMSATPTEAMHIATKQYVDTAKTEAQQLGLTAATPGQIIKVKTVQDGKPTEWEAVDMPSGDKWEKIKEITIAEGAEESNALTINADENGNTFRLKKARLCAKFPAYSGTSTIPSFSFAMLNGIATGRVKPLMYTSLWPKISTKTITGAIYTVDVSGAQQIEHAQYSSNVGWSDDTSHDYRTYGSSSDQLKTVYGDTLWAKPITSIGGSSMLIYPGCHFVLYGVRE